VCRLPPLFDDTQGGYASRFADAFGISLEVLHSGDVLPFAGWDDSVGLLSEPPLDPYSLLYLSYRQALNCNSRVALSGNGGDEVLRLKAAPYLRFLAQRRGLFFASSTLARRTFAYRRLPPLGFGIRCGFLSAFRPKPSHLTYPPWLAPDFERRHHLSDRWVELSATPPSLHPFNPKAYHASTAGYSAKSRNCAPAAGGSLALLNNVETHNRIQYSQNEISTHENRT